MKQPPEIGALLARRFAAAHRDWLVADSADLHWPMTIALGVPTEQQAMREVDAVRAWVAAWRAWSGAGELAWVERKWKVLGAQRVPATLTLHGPADVARWADQDQRWARAERRHATMVERWPALGRRLGRLFAALADYEDADFVRLLDMLAWLLANPASGLYLRQVPVAGIDTKWLETRKAVLGELLGLLRPGAGDGDFYRLCGLARPAPQLRMRILDAGLRARAGGMGDITAPVADIAGLALPVSTVLIVENLQTGLAFGDLPGTVVFMALGYSVDLLSAVGWIGRARCIYWGDIDTHGFAILSRARWCLPALESVMMDQATLVRYRPLWTAEALQHPAQELPLLCAQEAQVYRQLKHNELGHHLRLEQERIDWSHACSVLAGLMTRSAAERDCSAGR